jgi:hypothetical protein
MNARVFARAQHDAQSFCGRLIGKRQELRGRSAVDDGRRPVYKGWHGAGAATARRGFDSHRSIGARIMTPDSNRPKQEPSRPELGNLNDALNHVDTLLSSGNIAVSAAKGIVYSVIETLGALVGDPDLPEHSRAGYEGLLETARELRAKIGK